MSVLRIILLCAILVAGLGCAAQQPAVAERGEPVLLSAEMAQAVSVLNARAAQTEAMQGLGLLSGKWGRYKGEYSFAFALHRPGRLRLDLLDPAVGIIGTLLLHDDHLVWYLPGEQKLYRMPATAQSVQKLARLDLAPVQLLDVLAGLPPGTPLTDWQAEASGALVAPSGQHEVVLDQATAQTVSYRHFKNQSRRRLVTSVEFADYRPVENVMLPYHIAFESRKSRTKLQVTYQELIYNPTLSEDIFVLETTPQTKVVQW